MKKILSSMLGAAFLLASCVTGETVIEGGSPSASDVKLTIEVEDLGGAALSSTRGQENTISVKEENIIRSLYLLFFRYDSSDRTYYYENYGEVALPGPEVAPPYGGTSMNVDGMAFPAAFKDEAYSVLAIANVEQGNFLDVGVQEWMSQWTGKTLEYVMNNAYGVLPSATIASNRLPMFAKFDKPADETEVHLLLTRSVSRLDVTNELTDYDLVSASVWNAYRTTSIWGGGIVDYSANTKRVRYHYGTTPDADNLQKIRGGLYAFENQVREPGVNDEVTTCLIVGLRKRTGGTGIEYFRANLIDEVTKVHNLKRNHVYNLVIKEIKPGVEGETTEEMAYMGEGNKLIVRVGEWDEDTNGLVVADQYSTLSVSTKTVNMGGTDLSGSTAELTVHTFSTLPSPAPLKIHSQTYRPTQTADGQPSIKAHLEGNTLVIEAEKFDPGQDSRSGVIVLSYAGLEIAVNVSQSGKHNDYLIVTEPDGGILPFQPHASLPSGLIDVKASGEWTARLYMDGYSFDGNSAIDAAEWIWTDAEGAFTDGRGADNRGDLITPGVGFDGKFRVFTHTANTTGSLREAFVIVQLDKDPEAYSSVIMLSQIFSKALKYAPSTSTITGDTDEDWMQEGGNNIVFDGSGNLISGSTTFFINPGKNAQNSYQIISASVVASGLKDDRDFFSASVTRSATDLTANTVTINVKNDDPETGRTKLNMTGEDRMVKVRVQTDQSTFTEFNVVQRSGSFRLMPGILDRRVSAYGGQSDPVAIDLGETTGLYWRISEIARTQTMSDDGRQLVNHGEPTIKVYDAGGNPQPFELNKQYPQDWKFSVDFPQIYFPNRRILVGANVTVAVSQLGNTTGGMRQSIAATQEPLTARPVYVRTNTEGTGYASITGSNLPNVNWAYVEAYKPLLHSMAEDTGGALEVATWDPVPTNTPKVNYVHRTNQALNSTSGWTNSVRLLGKDGPNQGVLTIMGAYGGDAETAGLNTLGRGWTFVGNTAASGVPANVGIGTVSSINYTGAAATKLGEFIFHRVGSTSAYNITGATATFFDLSGNGDHTRAVKWPASAVVFRTEDIPSSGAIVVIDPKDRILYVGEDEAFTQAANQFLTNTMFWLAYAAQYGSSFSDLLIEDEGKHRVENGVEVGGGMPAPWDPIWGANAIEHFDDYNQ
jgi:hypothetical protein